VTVVLAHGREYPATVLGNSLSCDVAVLKLNVGNLKPVKIGNSDLVKPGDFAIAIGSPYALDNTVTFGVISALNRTIQTNAGTLIEGVFQTDAAINPGNSGGPLLNTDGDVIGMNTAIFTTTGAYQGIGFSIPIKTVYSIANRLIDISKTQ
jgi:serine protease Do